MDAGPLTYMQQRLLDRATGSLVDSGKIWLSYDIHGPLDVGALVGTVQALVERHDALRIRTVRDSSGAMWQYAHDNTGQPQPVTLQQVACDSAEVFVQHVESRLSEELHSPYDLTSEPPARFFLFRLTPQRHAFLAVFSRFVLDGRSRAMLSSELWQTYAAIQAGDPPPAAGDAPSFLAAVRRLIALNAKRAAGRNSEYWKECLAPAPSFGQLGKLQSSGRNDAECVARDVTIPAAALARLQAEAERARRTLFETLYAKMLSVFADALGIDRLAVLTMNDFRTVGERDVIGTFAGSLPIVLDREEGGDRPFSVQQVQRAVLRARVHGYIAPEVLTECYQRLEQEYGIRIQDTILVSYIDHTVSHATPESVAGLSIAPGPGVPQDLASAPMLDVLVSFAPDEVRIGLVFNTSIFGPAVVDQVIDGLRDSLATEVAASPA